MVNLTRQPHIAQAREAAVLWLLVVHPDSRWNYVRRHLWAAYSAF